MAKYSSYHNACLCQAKQPFYDVTIDFMNLLFPGTAIFHLVCTVWLAIAPTTPTHPTHSFAREIARSKVTRDRSAQQFSATYLTQWKGQSPREWLHRTAKVTREEGTPDVHQKSFRDRITGPYCTKWAPSSNSCSGAVCGATTPFTSALSNFCHL